jgi:hypothetical protein
MKLRPQIELEDSDINDDQEPEILEEKELDSGLIVNDILTPSGKKAVSFISPISENEVIIRKPNTRDILNIERDMSRNHKNAGNVENAIVMLSHLLVGYGDKKGDKILSFNKISDMDLEEVMLISTVMTQSFFSSVMTPNQME